MKRIGLITAALAVAAMEFLLLAASAAGQRLGFQAGANTLTNLIPTLYQALDIVSREQVGLIPAVSRDSGIERAALNQTVNIYIAPPIVGGNIAPGATPPADGDAVLGNTTATISKSRYWPVRWNGEEQKAVGGSGQRGNVVRDQFAQAFRAACNEVEADLAALHVFMSRAYGTAGTAPFGTAADLSDFAQARKILVDNGAPASDLRLVFDTTAGANLRGKQSVLFKVNEAGTADMLRNGILGQVQGLMLGESAQILTPAKGTGAGYLINNGAGYAVGTTALTLDTGAGTIIAGDVVTLAGDTNKYVVATALAANVVTLAEPGLRQAVVDNAALTVGNVAARNMLFSRSAIALATRAPALPDEGDMADDRTFVTDPVSGLSFEVSLYKQYRQVKYEVALAWGMKVIAPRHGALLLG